MNFHMVMEVIQNKMPAITMVIIPGTQPKTLKNVCQRVFNWSAHVGTYESDHV